MPAFNQEKKIGIHFVFKRINSIDRIEEINPSRIEMDKKFKIFIIFFFVRLFIQPWEQLFSEMPENEVPDWARNARLVGITYESIEEARQMTNWAANSGASVIDIDVNVNNTYARFLEPDRGIELLKIGCDLAHAQGLHAFAYLSGFEIITPKALHPNGRRNKSVPSVYTEHPDWLQVDQHGEPAVFMGSVAHWLEKTDESAWITPLNPEWRERYLHTVARVVRETTIDGIFIDVTTFMASLEGWKDRWPSFDRYMLENFEKSGGQWPFEVGNFEDKNFRKWIQFRHQVLLDFLRAVKEVIHSIRPEVLLINENYPGGQPDAISQAGAPYNLVTVCDLLAHEWEPQEIDALNRKEYGWLFYYAGIRFFRELDNHKPSWILSYVDYGADPESMEGSNEAKHAMINLAAATIMAGANFWECGANNMIGTSTNLTIRSGLFQWLAANEKLIYDPTATVANAVGIYFSPIARDYVDAGSWGIHQSACYGLAMALIENHVNFKLITPRNISEITPTELPYLIIANVSYFSEGELTELTSYLNSGGKILAYGKKNDLFDLNGAPKAVRPLVTLSNIKNATLLQKNADPGGCYFYASIYSDEAEDYIFPEYPISTAKNACSMLAEDLRSLNYHSCFMITAPNLVVFRWETAEDEERIFLINLNGATQNNAPNPNSPVTITYQAKSDHFIDSIPFYGDSPEVTHAHDSQTETGTISVAPETSWRGIIIRLKPLSHHK